MKTASALCADAVFVGEGESAYDLNSLVGDGLCAVPQILPRVFHDFMGKIIPPML